MDVEYAKQCGTFSTEAYSQWVYEISGRWGIPPPKALSKMEGKTYQECMDDSPEIDWNVYWFDTEYILEYEE
jgi:hypothetical protein